MDQDTLKKLLQGTRDERRGGTPREDWVTTSREILLMQVKNTTDTAKPKTLDQVRHLFGIFVPAESAFMAVRVAGIFLMLTATILGGGLVSAQMYRDSMPGEMLYGVKVAVEKVQLVLSPNDEYRLHLHVEFADRRANELAWLAETPGHDNEMLVSALVAFEKDVVSLRNGMDDIAASDPDSAVEVAKMLERKMTLYHNILQKASVNMSPDMRMAINVTKNRIDDAAISAMAVIVQGHLQGDARTPRNIVINKFEDRIKEAEHSLDTVIADKNIYEEKSPAIKAKTAIAEAKILLEEENYQAALNKIVEVAQLTKEAEKEAIDGATEAAESETGADAGLETQTAESAGSSEADASEDAVGSGSR